jgi:two-component system CheB/CheR fusion protein
MAHDFNNVLAAISANLDMVTVRSKDEKIHQAVQAAMDAIQMGASLNRRLLSFSGRRGSELERLDLNDHVTGTVDMLRRTLGDRVTVALNCAPEPYQTLANPGDIDNAILNLAINARDAIPNGGVVTVETRHVALDANAATRIANARPGDFIRLTVSDTGGRHDPRSVQARNGALLYDERAGHGAGSGHGVWRSSTLRRVRRH